MEEGTGQTRWTEIRINKRRRAPAPGAGGTESVHCGSWNLLWPMRTPRHVVIVSDVNSRNGTEVGLG